MVTPWSPYLIPVYCLLPVLAFWMARVLARGWHPRELPHRRACGLLGILLLAQAFIYHAAYMALHANFMNGAVDMATISQGIWKIMHGRVPFMSILGIHTLRDHFSPLFYAVAAIFQFWPTISWLVLLSNLSVALTALAVYALARHALNSNWLGLAAGISFLLNPWVHMGQMAAAHAENFTVGFIGLSLLALWRRRFLWFWMCMLVALLGKEDVGFYYGAVGVYVGLGLRRPGQGLAIAAAGLTWSAAVYTWIMPLFGPDTVGVISRFSRLGGDSVGAIGAALALHPWRLVTPLLDWDKLSALFFLLAQTGFSVFWAGWAWLPLAAALWLKSVTDYPLMYLFWDHYALHVMPFFYYASILGMKSWLETPRYALWRARATGGRMDAAAFLAIFLIILSLQINLIKGDNPLGRKFNLSAYTVTEHNRIGHRLLRQIPERASVLAQEYIATHLSFRDEIYAVTKNHHWRAGEKPLFQPEYAVFDLQADKKLPHDPKIRETAEAFYADSHYAVLAEENGWILFKKRGDGSPRDDAETHPR